MFTSFDPVTEDWKLVMGNLVTSNLRGKGKAALEKTSGKKFILNNVLFVPGIRNNMVSGWLPHASRGKQSGL